MDFKVNDKVICLRTENQIWTCVITNNILEGPKTDEILIIDSIRFDGCLYFNKYKYDYMGETVVWDPNYFRKLDYDFAEQILENIINNPIKIKQP